MGEFIQVEREGRIAILTMNRPEIMNPVSTLEDCDDFAGALDALSADRSVSVAILTGAGKAFSAGGDLKGMRDRNGIGVLDQPDSTRANYRRGVQKVVRAFMHCEVPLIAAVNGHAVGLGCDLACLCDMRIAGESAKFAASFIKVGIIPGDGGAWSLQQVVGYARAAEMFYTGDRYSAEEAKAVGLVSRVVSDDDLMTEAKALAERIAANPPRALRLTKRLLREAQTANMAQILELSGAFQAIAHETADHREAIAAFFDKRPPEFTGE